MHKGVERKSDVNAASLLDLKAELFRKQEEFKQQKLQNQETGVIKGKHSVTSKKPSLFSKKNAGVSERAEKDFEAKQEEEDMFLRSKKSLESKAKLYEKISSGAEFPDEDGSGLFLVDFQKKAMDDEIQRREKERQERERLEEVEERRLQDLPVPAPENEDDEWVDYVDAYGRTRRCLKQDLPSVQERDKLLQGRKRDKEEKQKQGLSDFQRLRDKDTLTTPSLMSDDMARELERQRWEQAEMAQMMQEKQGPIHYADVRHNEVRTHGVGFYQFNAEEEVRQAQMEQLQNLREQTKSERSKSDRVKEKRKAALAARLAKVKQRKREKHGLPAEKEEAVEEEEEEFGPRVSEQVKEPEILTRDDSWRTTTLSTREWDRGKQMSLEQSEKAWLEKQRAERETEFAPPSFYYGNQGNETGKRSLADIEKRHQNTAESPSLKDTLLAADTGDNDKNKGVIEKMVGEQLNVLRTSMENMDPEHKQDVHNNKQQLQYAKSNMCYSGNNDSYTSQMGVAPTVKMGPEGMFLDMAPPSTISPMSAATMHPMFTVPAPVNIHVPPPINFNVLPPGYTSMSSQYFRTGAPNFSVPPPPVSFPCSASENPTNSPTQGPFNQAPFTTAPPPGTALPLPNTSFQNFNVPPPQLFSPTGAVTAAVSYPYVHTTGNTTTQAPVPPPQIFSPTGAVTAAVSYPYVHTTGNTTTQAPVPPPQIFSPTGAVTAAVSYPYVHTTGNTTTQALVKKVVPKMSIVDKRFMGND